MSNRERSASNSAVSAAAPRSAKSVPNDSGSTPPSPRGRRRSRTRNRQVNTRLIVISLVLVVAGSVGIWAANRVQRTRMADSLIERADAASADDWRQAAELLREYLQLRPSDIDVAVRLADLQMTHADPEQSEDWFQAFRSNEELLRHQPHLDDIRRRHVEVLLRLGRLADAREHLAMLLEKNPTSGELHLLMAVTLSAEKRYSDAAAEFDRALDDPEFQSVTIVDRPWTRITVYSAWASLLRERMNQPGPADNLFDRLIKEHPDSVEAYLARSAYRSRFRLIGAADDARKAWQLDPRNIDALVAAAELTLADSKSTDAQIASLRESLKAVTTSDPARADVYQVLAAYERRNGNSAAAASVLEQGVEQTPEDSSLLFHLAMEWARCGPETGEKLQELLDQARTRDDVQTAFVEGCLLLHNRQSLAAVERFKHARAAMPATSEQHLLASVQLARCLTNMGRLETALRELDQLLSAHPRSAAARLALAETLAAARRFEDARRIYQSVAILDDLSALALASIEFQLAEGAKSARTADWAAVEIALQRAENAGADPIAVALLRARAMIAQGDRDAASQVLSAAQQASPDRPEPRAALASLAIVTGDLESARGILEDADVRVDRHPELDVAWLEYLRRTDEPAFRARLVELEQRAYPGRPDWWIQLQEVIALYYGLLKDAEGHLRVLANIATTQPEHVERWFRLIEPALELGRDDLADQALVQLQHIDGPQGMSTRLGTAVQSMWMIGKGDDSRLRETRLLLEAFLKETPVSGVGRAQVYSWLGRIDLQEGKRRQAADRMYLAAKEGSPDPKVWVTAAQLLIEQQRTAEALELLRTVAGSPAGAADSGVALATAHMLHRLNRSDDALALAQSLVSSDRANPQSVVFLGMLHSSRGEPHRAEHQFREAIRLAPSQPDGWIALVDHLVRHGDHSEAEQAVAEAERTIDAAAAAPALAICYEIVGRMDDAEKQLQSALDADPHDARLIQQLAGFYLRTGKAQLARESLQPVLADPTRFEGVDLVIVRRLMSGALAGGRFADYQEAVRLLETNLEGSTDPVTDRRLLGRMLLLHRHPDYLERGLDHLRMVERTGSLTDAERFAMAQALDRLEDYEASELHWQELLQPGRRQPKYVIGFLRRELDRRALTDVTSWMQELESLAPGDFETVEILARIDVQQGDIAGALARLSSYATNGGDESDRPARKNQVAGLLAELALLPRLDDAARRELRMQADSLFGELTSARPESTIERALLVGRSGELSRALDALDEARLVTSDVAAAAAGVQLLQACPHEAADIRRVTQWVLASRRARPGSLFAVHIEESLRRVCGEYDEAIRLNGLILKAAPDHAIALNNLAWLLSVHKGEHEKAFELIEQAMQSAGPTPFLLDTRGLIHLALGQKEAALEDFRASWIQERLSVTRFHLARALLANGDRESARYHLAAAIEAGLAPRDLEQLEAPLLRELSEELGVEYN